MIIKLSGELIIGNLEESYCSLLPILNCKEDTQFDISQVTRIDSAGLQLLLSATQTLRTKHLGWHWTEIPPKIASVARTLAVDTALGFKN